MAQQDVSGRNRFALTRRQLLEDYAHISSRRKNAAVATSLRMESVQYRDLLAYEATHGVMEFTQLKHSILQERLPKIVQMA